MRTLELENASNDTTDTAECGPQKSKSNFSCLKAKRISGAIQ